MPTLFEIRISKDLSQKQVAEMAGLTAPTYNRIENGRASTTLKSLHAICRVLGVLPDDVTGVKLYSRVQTFAKRKQKNV